MADGSQMGGADLGAFNLVYQLLHQLAASRRPSLVAQPPSQDVALPGRNLLSTSFSTHLPSTASLSKLKILQPDLTTELLIQFLLLFVVPLLLVPKALIHLKHSRCTNFAQASTMRFFFTCC